jgi:hypothetical protein
MFVLPISRAPVELRAPSGHDELMISEAGGGSVGQRVEVVRRLALPTSPGADWYLLPYVDIDAALLGLRQFLYGDKLVAEIQCSACGAWGDIQLSITEYLRANRPRGRRAETPSYVPTVSQVLSAVAEHGPGEAAARALEAACLRACNSKEARRKRAELERAAPPLAGPVEGLCPRCGTTVSGWFDPGGFVLAELGARAAALLQEVHLLASRYGWSEEAILAMPERRRAAYAETITAEGRGQ